MISDKNELAKCLLLVSKKKLQCAKVLKTVYRYFNIYCPKRQIFIADPHSVFTIFNEELVMCRNTENNFVIYNLSLLDVANAVVFHKVYSK